MELLERFKKAVEYLKTKAQEPTNEAVSRLLGYKTKNYISDVIGGSKDITPFLLERMVEFSINPDWIQSGKGEMLKNNTPPPERLLVSSEKKYTIDDYIREKDARINDLKEFNNRLFDTINSSLGNISKVQQAIYAMARTALEYEAAIASQGDTKKEAELLESLSILNVRNHKRDATNDNAVVLHRKDKG